MSARGPLQAPTVAAKPERVDGRAARVLVVMPALNEEHTVARVIEQMRAALVALSCDVTVIVGDNGSTDRTAQHAMQAGAVVANVPERGYGRACLAALALAPVDTELVLFCDADGADDPGDVARLIGPVLAGGAELAIGVRAVARAQVGALSVPQLVGNRVATALLKRWYGQDSADLGPFRCITSSALARLQMDDVNFGWTVQMQARAARLRMRVVDVNVNYRRRTHGSSKVSTNVIGAARAGEVILRTLWRERSWVAR